MKTSAIGLLSLCLAAWAQQPQDQQPTAPPAQPQPASPAQTGQPNIQAPPELPKYPDVRLPGEYGFWLTLQGSIPRGQPTYDKGHGSLVTTSAQVTMQGTPKVAEGAELGIALGLHNALRLSWFSTRASGNFTSGKELTLWNQDYAAGTFLATDYRVQDYKVSFDYLTWPYPVESRRFRLKTLWQLHYVTARTGFDAPQLPITNPDGTPITDAAGNPITYQINGTRWYITPALGLGIADYITRNVRIEANAAGFTIPHHTTTWDLDASVNFRFGHFEVGAGGRAFHFKTSTDGPYYLRGTVYAPAAQIRWYSH